MISRKDVCECLLDLIGPEKFTVASGRRFEIKIGSKEASLYLYPNVISAYMKTGSTGFIADVKLDSIFDLQEWLITNFDL